ncbi:hypothetical protein KPL71_008496 [Citrus sinensis]|uniref:Uncharacterized protein n=2 Tax=Citrus sinensis TaxID=2711 RepID=A0ACB8M6W8_CITSI|nr:hypothetical protein KPL71_008483 [Citrus sinensis]KAH9781486.1 hypothetical protein KPL71_008496 [Citrus sinensis]
MDIAYLIDPSVVTCELDIDGVEAMPQTRSPLSSKSNSNIPISQVSNVFLVLRRQLFAFLCYLFIYCCFVLFSSFSSKRHLRGFAKKWRIHLQEEANGQNSYKHLLVHVVKEGETLTSISKQYGVSVYSIAAVNKNIVDVDLVFEGQRLNIPSSVREELQAIWRNRLPSFDLKETLQHSLNVFDGPLDKKYFIMEITHGLPQAKTTGYFLVVVPLIAFCIRCMIGAFHTRIAGGSGHQVANGSKGRHPGSKTVRWKSALRDIIEEDLDSGSRPRTNDPVEEQDQAQPLVSFEESSHAYRKLEDDYEKFLSECGMSKWGYWRGEILQIVNGIKVEILQNIRESDSGLKKMKEKIQTVNRSVNDVVVAAEAQLSIGGAAAALSKKNKSGKIEHNRGSKRRKLTAAKENGKAPLQITHAKGQV